MAQNIINISPENESKLSLISSVLAVNGKKKSNKSDLLNETVSTLYDALMKCDDKMSQKIFGLKKVNL